MFETIFIVVFSILLILLLGIIGLSIRSSRSRREILEQRQQERAKRQAEMFAAMMDSQIQRSKPPPGIPERRSGKDRRSGVDRRQTLRFQEDRRKSPGRRREDYIWSHQHYPEQESSVSDVRRDSTPLSTAKSLVALVKSLVVSRKKKN
jgi:heme exporter protein D